MTRETLNKIENDYWEEKADPIDMTEVFDLANKALEIKEVPTGKWEKEDRGHVEYTAVCSVCGETEFWSERSKYCPSCGSLMIEEQQGENT